MKIYIAGPLFTVSDRKFLEEIDKLVKELGFETYLPHRDGGIFKRSFGNSEIFFKKDSEAINNLNIILAVLNGTDVDSGTAWEIGYAYSKGIKIIGFLDDTRKPSSDLLNPMIYNSLAKIFSNLEELKKYFLELKNE
ncbi:MAG: nucleoside 2-deoxyribosyltransferase [archaeon]